MRRPRLSCNVRAQLSLSHIVSCRYSRRHHQTRIATIPTHDPTRLNAYQRPSHHDRHSSHIPHEPNDPDPAYRYICSSPPAILNCFLPLCTGTGSIPSIILFYHQISPLTILMSYPTSLIVACNYPYDHLNDTIPDDDSLRRCLLLGRNAAFAAINATRVIGQFWASFVARRRKSTQRY